MKNIELRSKIQNKTVQIAVVGLGYIGMPLIQLLLENNFKVVGIDWDREKIKKLNIRESYLSDFTDGDIKRIFDMGLLVTDSYDIISNCDIVIICVPTPLSSEKKPDLTLIEQACLSASAYLTKDTLIIVESTIYVGATRNVIKEIFDSGRLKCGKDYFLAFSPERISPGTANCSVADINKLVSGVEPHSAELALLFYNSFLRAPVYLCSSCEVAEMSKLLENTFRYINIAFINEIAMLCKKMNINVFEVIEAAKSKPMGFYPNIGAGGHCIMVDSFYLKWIAQQNGVALKMVDSSESIIKLFFEQFIEFILTYLEENDIAIEESQILIIGLAYKEFVNDTRESPSIKLMKRLIEYGCRVDYYDELIPNYKSSSYSLNSIKEMKKHSLEYYDVVILMNKQNNLNYQDLVDDSKLIIDVKNIIKKQSSNVIKI